VGSFEYGNALPLLTQFVALATSEELKVAEQIVAARDEFTVYTNLSRRIEPKPGPLSERGTGATDKFDRRGLAWLIALARVELASMAAGFSPDAEPFGKSRPGSLELDAYREVLADSMRSHYWSLVRDPVPRTMRRRVTPDPQAIAYLRRTNLAIKFVDEVGRELQGQLTSTQQSELDTWEQQLKGLQSYLLYDVLGVHDPVVLSNSSTELYLHKCGTTREMILSDLRSGGARIVGASAETVAAVRKEAGLPASGGGAKPGEVSPPPVTAPATPPNKPPSKPPTTVARAPGTK
jgi:hypothetical protein